MNLAALKHRSWWNKLVARCQDDDAGATNARHAREPKAGNGRGGERCQSGTWVEDDVACLHVGTHVSHEVAARDRLRRRHHTVDDLNAFDRHDGIGTVRQHATRGNRCCRIGDERGGVVTGEYLCRDRPRSGRSCLHGVPIHRRIGVRGEAVWRHDCFSNRSPRKLREPDRFCVEQPHGVNHARPSLVDGHAFVWEFSGHVSVKVTSLARRSWYTAMVLVPNRPTETRQ